uniref:Uncharacterized protein n=1 Tax=Arundo donax TaxID=35708 RepID=A0A0A8ZJK1_ARUDO
MQNTWRSCTQILLEHLTSVVVAPRFFVSGL